MQQTVRNNTPIKYIFKAILFCILFTGIFIILSFLKSGFPEEAERITHGIIGTIAALLTTFLFLKLDKRSFADIGLRLQQSTFKNFSAGLLSGLLLMGLLAFSVIYFSEFEVKLNERSNLLSLLIGTFPLLPLAFMEELAFRGYPLQVLQARIGARYAIIITSVLFAVYHIINGWTLQNAFLGAGVWGIIYGLAAIYSKGIAMPTGLHYAANLTTATFGLSDTSHNIFILTQANGVSLENYQSSEISTLLPQISLFIFGIICMEWYLSNERRRKTIS